MLTALLLGFRFTETDGHQIRLCWVGTAPGLPDALTVEPVRQVTVRSARRPAAVTICWAERGLSR